jgi:hypothetical protein
VRTVHKIVYTVECEITFTDDEVQSQEDLRGFRDYVMKPECKDSWVAESVREGNFVVTGTRYEVEVQK